MECIQKNDRFYIEKSKELIKTIPKLKQNVLNLKEKLKVGEDENIRAQLYKLVNLLKFLIESLSNIGELGEILIDIYFNGLNRRELEDRYCKSSLSISRLINGKTTSSEESWTKLSVLLYGIDAVRLGI